MRCRSHNETPAEAAFHVSVRAPVDVDVQGTTLVTTQRCLPMRLDRSNPWRSNIETVPLWRNEAEVEVGTPVLDAW
jgi:hypothetical protein